MTSLHHDTNSNHEHTPVDLSMQAAILRLQQYWSARGCMIGQPMNTEVGAGTANPSTMLRVLGPEPWRTAYVEPSVRPDDSRYGENPNRLQTHTQFQVILKPEPTNPQELYLGSLEAIGIDLRAHDVRFVEDNWASPALGAWGLGWEVWLDGMEITQFTYFQQAGGIPLDPVSVEITYGLERIMMALQDVSHFKDIEYAPGLKYGEVFGQSEYEMSRYYLDDADVELQRSLFEEYAAEAERLVAERLPVPAYGYVLRCSHTFNVLDARGAVSTTERARAFTRMRTLTRDAARLWSERREELGHPLGAIAPTPAPTVPTSPVVEDTRDVLLEIGLEELPADGVPETAAAVEAAIRAGLAASKLDTGAVTVRATPRRVAVSIADVAPREQDMKRRLRGPRASAAHDADGKPTRALEGFLRSNGASPDAVVVAEEKGVDYVFVDLEVPGRSSVELLGDLFAETVRGLRAARNIRWSDPELSFSRPIRWLVALIGDDIIPVVVSGLVAGRTTRVLRTDDTPEIDVEHADEYEQVMREHGIVLDRDERRSIVLDAARQVAASVGGTIDEHAEAALIEEITDIVEAPVPLSGRFDERYLELPEVVLTTVMKKHQRYLPIRSGNALSNTFVIVANGACNEDVVRRGNESVLRARYEDASFFWRADLEVGPEEFRARLDRLLFEERLGSMADRADRIRILADAIAGRGSFTDDVRTVVARAGELAKFDLASQLVIELSSLAGDMAEQYALHGGESAEIATTLREMESPRSAGEPVPGTLPGAVLSVADRLDGLVGLYAIGARSSGSSDPFGLRRMGNGIVAVLRSSAELGFLSLRDGIDLAADGLGRAGHPVDDATRTEIFEFLVARYEKQHDEEGARKETVRAVLPSVDHLVDADRLLALIAGADTSAGWRKLVESMQRVGRIVATADVGASTASYGTAVEQRLDELVQTLEAHPDDAGRLADLVDRGDVVSERVDAFFDGVLVMDEDLAVRASRIALLRRLAAVGAAVDWSVL